MPTYTLEDTETGEQHDVLMSWNDLQEYKKSNPHLKQVIGSPNIVSKVGSRTGLGQSGDLMKYSLGLQMHILGQTLQSQ